MVAANPSGVQSAYGAGGALGPWTGRLSNSGEDLHLRDNNGREMDEVVYGTDNKWPAGADGAAAGQAFPETEGKDIYAVICQSCHMPDGKGAHNTAGGIGYPALAGNPKLAAKAYPALVIARGQKAMPSLGGLLNDTQIANVVNYIRTSFGNTYADPITAAQVTPLRPARPVTGTVRPPG